MWKIIFHYIGFIIFQVKQHFSQAALLSTLIRNQIKYFNYNYILCNNHNYIINIIEIEIKYFLL